jgi:DNA polymerase III delta prime subunit
MTKTKEYLWVEKYRPKLISECILPESIKTTFQQMVDSGESQNLLLSGGAGCGKTTIAKALCNELETDYIMVNCSEDGNIDTLRTKIRNFASTVSITGGKKIVILDEFDYSNAQSTQPALRGFIEEFSENCRFILTCNFKNRIIEPLHSRCTIINFTVPKKEKPTLASQFMDRVKYVLDNEGILYEEKVLAQVILKHFPDFRRVLNELQRYSIGGSIDVGILSQIGEIHIKDLVSHMKSKDFTSARKWAVENLDNSPSELFRKVYDGLYDYVTPSSIPQAVLILAEYQYKSAFVADQEINLVACVVELMMGCEFK